MTPEELRLRKLTERIRERARSLPAGEAIGADPTPTPSATVAHAPATKPEREAPLPHWQEAAEEKLALERHEAGPAPFQVEAREVARRETACARLRRLLADGRRHGPGELVEAGGLRFGGRLHELRRGDDGGPPLDVEGEHRGGGAWFYRVRLPENFDSSGAGRETA